MNFFEAQDRAKKRTSRLVAMFIVAVIGTIIAMYVAVILVASQTQGRHRYAEGLDWWQPEIFAGVALATIAVVGLGSLYKWSEFSAGGSAVAESVGGRRIDSNSQDPLERRLLNVVEEMAIASGVPVPAVYVMDEEPAINAFAAGLTTNDAVVAVTRGTLEKLNRDELQGVIGHEFSHILNGDMRLNLRIAAVIFGILVLGVIGRGIIWSMRGVRVGSRDNKNSGGVAIAIFAIGAALIVVGYIGYFFGRLIQAAVSRQREFLADASAVQFTRNPSGIAGALRKIGGFSLGSTMRANQSAAIGHFFFSQAFESGFTGLWATHPPLAERIRAIDPSFEGTMVEPSETAAVGETSAERSGFAPSGRTAAAAPFSGATRTANTGGAISARLSPTTAVAAIDAIGSLSPAQIANAQTILDATPGRLRAAAQTATEARVLLYGLLLNDDADTRRSQRATIASRAGSEALRLLDELDPALREVRDEHRLPLLQLAIPALRETPPSGLQPFLATLDDLIRADGQISTFEFALQRILTSALTLGRHPRPGYVKHYAFDTVTDPIAVVLSVLARASTDDEASAPSAFAAGAAQLKSIESRLSYTPEAARNLAAFDAALDVIAVASLPIKQRTLLAAAHVVQADGKVLVREFELLRAVAAALDVPMPPLAATV